MVIKVSIPNRFQFKSVPSFKTMLFQKQGEVHYIGGADILSEDFIFLIRAMKRPPPRCHRTVKILKSTAPQFLTHHCFLLQSRISAPP